MFQVPDWTLNANAVDVVVEERNHRASQSDFNCAGRRLERGNQTDQIAQQDEQKKSTEERRKAFRPMANDLLALSVDEVIQHLRQMLQRTWLIHGQPRADQQEENDQKDDNQDFH